MIKLQVIGNLGKDCVVNLVNGKNVMNFTVAHTEKFRDAQGAQKEKTIWVDCAYWSDKTGIAPYLKKGQQVYVEGNPDIRTYTTNDGRQAATITLRVSTVQLLGNKPGGEQGDGSAYQQPAAAQVSYQQSAPPQTSYTPAVPAAQNINDMSEPADDLPF